MSFHNYISFFLSTFTYTKQLNKSPHFLQSLSYFTFFPYTFFPCTFFVNQTYPKRKGIAIFKRDISFDNPRDLVVNDAIFYSSHGTYPLSHHHCVSLTPAKPYFIYLFFRDINPFIYFFWVRAFVKKIKSSKFVLYSTIF